MQVKNISAGPRGIWSTGGIVTLEPGEVREIELADGEEAGEWFEFSGEAVKPAKAAKPAKGGSKTEGGATA